MLRRRFYPIFRPEQYKLVCTEGSGLLLESLANNESFRRHCDDVKPAVSLGKNEEHTNWIDNQAHQRENANNQDLVPDMTEEPVNSPADVTAQHPNEDRATRPRRKTRLPATCVVLMEAGCVQRLERKIFWLFKRYSVRTAMLSFI